MVHSKINDKKSPLRPSLSWEEVTVNYKFLEELNIDYVGISEIVDSVNYGNKNSSDVRVYLKCDECGEEICIPYFLVK